MLEILFTTLVLTSPVPNTTEVTVNIRPEKTVVTTDQPTRIPLTYSVTRKRTRDLSSANR
jgi:hypothetical protein